MLTGFVCACGSGCPGIQSWPAGWSGPKFLLTREMGAYQSWHTWQVIVFIVCCIWRKNNRLVCVLTSVLAAFQQVRQAAWPDPWPLQSSLAGTSGLTHHAGRVCQRWRRAHHAISTVRPGLYIPCLQRKHRDDWLKHREHNETTGWNTGNIMKRLVETQGTQWNDWSKHREQNETIGRNTANKIKRLVETQGTK
jgi:hypothetical protein